MVQRALWGHMAFQLHFLLGGRPLLFQAGQFQSPLMERTATARYPWNAHFTFDPAKFGQVTRVNEFATCVASVRID